MGVPPPESTRLVSLDAYRGFIMLVMISGGFAFHDIAQKAEFKDDAVWQFLGFQFEHVPWQGGSFWDMIQPSFMFMVGVAMPYSHASRKNKGQSSLAVAGHTIYRALLLIFLGVFLSSNGARQTSFTFVNVLTQIGLGYCFVYLLIGRGLMVQLLALTAILVGYGAWFYLMLPPSDFNYSTVGLMGPYPWASDEIFAHWNKGTNAAAGFDDWFLNLFPQAARPTSLPLVRLGLFAPTLPFAALTPLEVKETYFWNNGGYQTLNFIPSMGTMILGLMAGEMLRRGDLIPREKLLRLCFAAVVCGILGLALGEKVCPMVKRIWTPTWTLYSSGWTFAMLAGFYFVIDMLGYRRWALPMVIVGMNSIAAYCMSQLMKPWLRDTLKTHLGQDVFKGTYFGHELFRPVFEPVAIWVAMLVCIWLATVWMYRQKIFVRI